MLSEPNEGASDGAALTAFIAVGPDEVAALRATLEGLAANTLHAALRLCLVVPDSIAHAVQDEVRKHPKLAGAPHWSVSSAALQPGHAGALREAAARHPRNDVVVIAPGAKLPFAWDARLKKAAYASPRIGAVIPMCDIAPEAALVDEALRGESLDAVRVDRTAYCMGNRSFYEIPRLHCACAYLRRDALDFAMPLASQPGDGLQGVLDEIARRMRAKGWS